MSKKILSRIGIAVIGVVLAVLYLMSKLKPETFGWFSLAIAIAIFSGLAGSLSLITGVFGKNLGIFKKTKIIVGAILLIVCVISCVWAALLPADLILPIIAIIVTVGLLLTILAVGGKKWAEGDNQKVGYKTYRERKADEDKKNQDEQD